MNKVFGLINEFTPMRVEGTRTVVSYGKAEVDKEHATWLEVYLPNRQHPSVGLQEVKDAIVGDINARTEEQILSGFQWKDNEGEDVSVWLSVENQNNFSEAHRLALQAGAKKYEAVTQKIGEDADGNAKYRTFETLDDLDAFYRAAYAHINQCREDGWAEKDGFDWSDYEALFPTADAAESAAS